MVESVDYLSNHPFFQTKIIMKLLDVLYIHSPKSNSSGSNPTLIIPLLTSYPLLSHILLDLFIFTVGDVTQSVLWSCNILHD